MLNRYGERTLPCRVPRVTQNDLLYEPFHLTTAVSLLYSYTMVATRVQVKHNFIVFAAL